MESVSAKSPLKRVGLSQGATNGIQSIVHLQFRKEHRSLLTLFEDLKIKIDKTSADAERRFEESQKQLKDTENRLEKLENEWRDLMQRNRKWEDEVRSLKEKMERLSGLMSLQDASAELILARGGDTELRKDQLSAETTLSGHGADAADLQQLTERPTMIPPRGTIDAREQRTSASTAEQRQTVSQSVSVLSAEIDVSLSDRNPRTPNRRQSSQAISPLTHDGPMSPPPPPRLPLAATTPTNKKIPPLSSKSLPNAKSRKAAHPPPWINISQTPDQTIEAYLALATEYNKAIKSRKSRFEFIARFIKGLLKENDREVLLKQLQKKFQSRTTKDGFVEVMCGFSDVGEGLVDAGLIGGVEGTSGKRGAHDAGMDHGGMDTLHQKRRKTLESQTSNDDEL
ncbi:uncharacterized protein EAF01_000019 [Botrytis porri]|uniref:Uncharacterized protein n=1 Tax=Botrytis porri TaxID=87229 RepID=A0A4Z1KNV5_9HELO|nr:uncharacterized protein EAF01_000019 [Botrytis porri]KAF7913613.1 hypothetical protein EAF01_000019 [Botrytis porri]TGO86022.1 hypothetical protein BPOR_0342g00060 [Botrytis porri]